jgi:hypothetical protein
MHSEQANEQGTDLLVHTLKHLGTTWLLRQKLD